ncbi:hypothetical protein CROQUDRAFT_73291 [Cronartium quercuum f. sp. fusiforme G11]|uniref:NudC domain-containing protein 1 n=1 Tax=Cronartium quercuum f. sp. fusiforme G11 TaxID=708437 RepID=A0A9P6TFA9_9BASI|nr:hypothetical protein CROQUDRAFT_73291 [Cronartium quercuum f. sp. fusiforme G11]
MSFIANRNHHQDVADGLCFNPSRKLLNPKFESYKLKQFDERNIHRIRLPKRFNSGLDRRQISFNHDDLKLEARANYLLTGCFPSEKRDTQSQAPTSQPSYLEPQLIWIEPNKLDIWSIIFKSPTTLEEPQILHLLTLPDVRHEPGIDEKAKEKLQLDYPSAVPIPTGWSFECAHVKPWLVSDGKETLFLVDLKPDAPSIMAQTLLSDELGTSGEDASRKEHRSFKVCSVQPIKSHPDTFWIILRSKAQYTTKLQTAQSSSATSVLKVPEPRFNVYLVQLQVLSAMSDGDDSTHFTIHLNTLAQLTGRHDVILTEFDSIRQRWCFSSHSKYVLTSQLEHDKPDDTSEHLAERSLATAMAQPPITAPYKWSQTSTTLTLQFPIPHTLPSKSINLIFDSDWIAFKLHEPVSTSATVLKDFLDTLAQHFKLQLQDLTSSCGFQLELWDHIQPADSVWYTECSEADPILTIELEKRHQLRWPQVFKTDDQVDQVFDSTDFEAIRSNLQKYTSGTEPESEGPRNLKAKSGLGSTPSNKPSSDQPPSFLGGYHTSLTAGGMDDEIDSANQTITLGAVFTWLAPVQSDSRISACSWDVTTPHDMLPVEIISTKLPLYNLAPEPQDSVDFTPSIMVKRDVDGLVFEPPSSVRTDPNLYQWTHTQTFPAMSFVMASKRDIRLTFHTDQHSFIFENSNAPSLDNKPQIGNMFIYRQTRPPDETVADQLVIKLNTTPCGALIGVAGLRSRSDKQQVEDESQAEGLMMVCLCEAELILCRNF